MCNDCIRSAKKREHNTYTCVCDCHKEETYGSEIIEKDKKVN